MNPEVDVLVIGAGPAGAVAAYAAARRGLSVLLVDRAVFPRFKVCGGCVNARALRTLERLGLGDLVETIGARPLSRLDVHVPGRSMQVPMPGSVSISRQQFDAALVERARGAGVSFEDGVSARMGPVEGATRRVALRSRDGRRRELCAATVVVADGLAGTALRGRKDLDARVAAASRMGAGTIVENNSPAYGEGVVTLTCGRGGYVGTVRVEDGRLDVAAALDGAYVREMGGPGPAAARLLDEAGRAAVPGLADADWRGTPALTRRRPSVAGERFFVLGDAAGYVEPFTGEGIAWAVEGAEALSVRIPAAVRQWDASLARDWTRCHRILVRRRQWGCRAVAAVLRRPTLARAVIALLARSPSAARPLVRRLTQPFSG